VTFLGASGATTNRSLVFSRFDDQANAGAYRHLQPAPCLVQIPVDHVPQGLRGALNDHSARDGIVRFARPHRTRLMNAMQLRDESRGRGNDS